VAEALCKLAPPTLALRFVEIRDLPLYDEDLEGPGVTPAAWVRFRAEIAGADAALFATPEYNRSVPGVLKNALDVGSRPYGRSVWENRPAAVVSVSPAAGASPSSRKCPSMRLCGTVPAADKKGLPTMACPSNRPKRASCCSAEPTVAAVLVAEKLVHFGYNSS
jgi:NAD(P)H-dependent FMN reductase